MPIAIPGVMIAIALIYVYIAVKHRPDLRHDLDHRVAYLTQYLPFGSRAMNSVMMQLHPELDEAGATSRRRQAAYPAPHHVAAGLAGGRRGLDLGVGPLRCAS